MSVARIAAVVGCGAGLVLAGHGAPVVAQQAAPVTRFVWDGVYTDIQADRGEREYGRSCAHCHGLALEGDGEREVPTLVSDPFMRRWRGRTVQALFDTLTRSMPADARGTLSPRVMTDVVAFLLRANGAPAGEAALPPDRDAMASLVIERGSSGQPSP